MLPLNQSFTIVERVEDFAVTAAGKIAALLGNSGDKLHLISLSGGSTPFPVYKKLAGILAADGTASLCHWIQTDERLVSADDERSNQRSIKNSLFKDGLLPLQSFLAAPTGLEGAKQSPASFERICQNYYQKLMTLPESLRPPAPIDLVMLGVGIDGHTASLFPGTDWQSRTSETGFAVFTPDSQPEPRLSLTLERIMQAREIVFLVNGATKQPVLQKIFFDASFASPSAFITRSRRAHWVIGRESADDRLASFARQTNPQNFK
jgi:6-phosphogluconolactonase